MGWSAAAWRGSRAGAAWPQEAMGEFPGLQYCKTDLMADKGVVFCKYGLSSQALAAMETVNARGMVPACPPRAPATSVAVFPGKMP